MIKAQFLFVFKRCRAVPADVAIRRSRHTSKDDVALTILGVLPYVLFVLFLRADHESVLDESLSLLLLACGALGAALVATLAAESPLYPDERIGDLL
jgi:hypothetical protein